MPPRTPHAFTLIETLVVTIALLAATAVLLPTFAYLRQQNRLAVNQQQLRGIHQGMVTWTTMSRRGPVQVLAYPGIDWGRGAPTSDGPDTGFSGDGTVPGARLWQMLAGNFFTPEYMINPADAYAIEMAYPFSGTIPPVTARNHSYAMLSLRGTPDETSEWIARSINPAHFNEGRWEDRMNPNAAILGDRAIGTGPADISSVWTESGSGEWKGHVVRNDNSAVYAPRRIVADTQYGAQPANPADDLFENDPATADAFLVHDDATTAYSAE